MWRDPGKVLLLVGFTLTTFSTLVVALRLYTRLFLARVAGLSDCTMLVALLSAWTITVLNYYQTKFGRDSRLSQVEKHPNSPRVQAALSGTLITWFIYRPFYIFTLSLIKLSILAFYRTLIPPTSIFRSLRNFRYLVYALMAFTIIYAISTVLASIFQCAPISAAYSIASTFSQILRHKKLPRPHCYEPQYLWVFTACINFGTDLIIFMLPIPIVSSLQSMPRRKRFGIFCILSVGTLAIVASSVRLWIMLLWSKDVRTRNQYGTELLTWGQVEINCGIVGASAMFLRSFFRQCLQRRADDPEIAAREFPGEEQHEMHRRSVSIAGSETIIGGKTGTGEGGTDLVNPPKMAD